LEVDPAQGLSSAEAARRVADHGENRLPEPAPPSLFKLVLDQIGDVTVLALIAAALIALVIALVQGEGSALERYGDTGAIMGIVVLNAVLGILQQKRADRALAALRELTAPVATVLRDGQTQELPAAQVVPGDVLVLEAGDRVAADARLVQQSELQVSEAALTGEARAVRKELAPAPADAELAERASMVYAGTALVAGTARAVVTATGGRSEVGRIATLVKETKEEPTPLERDLRRFGLAVVIGCVAASSLVFGIGMLQGDQAVRELFLIAVSLAVAAIPEGLPAITTIVLALGTHAMAKRGALVRRLHAVETLGCVQVLCTDKTGTVTRNRMKAVRMASGATQWEVEGGEPPPPALAPAAQVAGGARGRDPTDEALREAARAAGAAAGEAAPVAEVPFSAERRMVTTVFARDDGYLVTTRGATERVLDACDRILGDDGQERTLETADRERVLSITEQWADEAIRVLALARARVPKTPKREQGWEHDLVFVGLVGIADPLRPEVKPAVARSLQAGIRVMMITGDHPTTARAVAKDAGILTAGAEVVVGRELQRMEDAELDQRLPRVAVVARATAEDKLRIIQGLRRRNEVSGMTGDGVNDAPALKSADIGVAMGKAGTDVARESSSMVLADDNFATIVAAVGEGRAIYANIRRFISFLFASNAGLVLAVTVASVLGWDPPMAPIQILWINLITNGLPALALGLEPSLEDHMSQPPRRPEEPILRLSDALGIALVGAIMAGGGLWVYYEACAGVPTASTPGARSAAFTVFALAPLLYSFSARSDHTPLWRLGPLSNRLLVGAVLVGAGLGAVAVFLPGTRALFRTGPMSTADWGRVALAAVVPFVVVEVWKMVGSSRRR
jgi:Ca2+-transporting ATPase